MRAKVALLPALLPLLTSLTLSLPVFVRSYADFPIENYVVFFTVEKEKLLAHGIEPASVCAVDSSGMHLPVWVPPETTRAERVAIYVKIPYLPPQDLLTIMLTPGPCTHDPWKVFIFFDDFKTLDTGFWTPFSTSMIHNATMKSGALGGKGLLIMGSYIAPDQYMQIISQPFAPPLAAEALVTPMTAFDHDACLNLREYGTEKSPPPSSRGASIHAWGYGVDGTINGQAGKLAWYRLAGPIGSKDYYWDVAMWNEGGSSPVFFANDTFLFRIGVSAEAVRYEVWQLRDEGLVKLLGHLSRLGITNEVVVALSQECGAAYNFTQKAVFHWVLVRPFVWPEPKVFTERSEIEENPPEPISKPPSELTDLLTTIHGILIILAMLAIVLVTNPRKRRES